MRLSFTLRSSLCSVLLGLAGCAETLPPVEGAGAGISPPAQGTNTSTAPTPAPSATGAPMPAGQPSAATAPHIASFKGRNVLLYSSSHSREGELVSASSFTLPMRIHSSRADRVEVMTVYGPRWVARRTSC